MPGNLLSIFEGMNLRGILKELPTDEVSPAADDVCMNETFATSESESTEAAVSAPETAHLITEKDIAGYANLQTMLNFLHEVEEEPGDAPGTFGDPAGTFASPNRRQKSAESMDLLRSTLYDVFGGSNFGIASPRRTPSLRSQGSDSSQIFIRGREGMNVMVGRQAIAEAPSCENSMQGSESDRSGARRNLDLQSTAPAPFCPPGHSGAVMGESEVDGRPPVTSWT